MSLTRVPKIGDHVTMTDKQLEDQRVSVSAIKAIAHKGYFTVSETFEYLPGKYLVCIEEDPEENVGYVDYTLL